ncbi:MAG: hypothetical protein Q7V20_13220 [Aquabacterium sp.]|uniref:hypothetical protein n=1 Tax=Aquabacterium sp. TaxID=1872578 RepID=UPI00272506C7|nr:hypothetical protein [Aquabacterium sp.]MDO9004406.1 hypothetical protein [Aquabacterium sp.]
MNPTEKKSPPQGDTLPSVKGKSSPRLPHEHDESADSQTSEPRPEMKQAHADIERGLVDTDRSPVADEVYNRTLKSGKPTGGQAKPRR